MFSARGTFTTLLIAATVSAPGTGAQAPAPARGTLTLAGIAPEARDAVFAAIDAAQGWRFFEAGEAANRAVTLDPAFGLARAVRLSITGAAPDVVATESRRATQDGAGRPTPEATYLAAILANGANANRLFGAAHAMLPNDRRIALDYANSFIGTTRLDSLRALVRQYPDFIAARSWLAYYLALSRYGSSDQDRYEAFLVAQEGMRLAPDNAQTHTAMGHVLQRMGRLDEAAAHLAAATRLDARLEYANIVRAAVYARDGKPKGIERARAAFDSAIMFSPNFARQTNQRAQRAMLLFYDGRKAEGMAELATVAKATETTTPTTTAVLYSQMAELAAGTGDSAAVDRYMADARRVSQTANLGLQAAQAYALSRQPAKARAAMAEYVRSVPDSTSLAVTSDRHRVAGMVLLAEGKLQEALAELRLSDLEGNAFGKLAMMDALTSLNDRPAAAALLASIISDRGGQITGISTALAFYRASRK
ncbi:MAG: hypothetical protein HY275_02760 [Gemmatimonadetes bacterium]|nr:hypothetical protein [Gemmatimonadota bacterium]